MPPCRKAGRAQFTGKAGCTGGPISSLERPTDHLRCFSKKCFVPVSPLLRALQRAITICVDISISLNFFHRAPSASWGAVATFDGMLAKRSQMNSELTERKDQLQQLCCQVLTGLWTCHTNL